MNIKFILNIIKVRWRKTVLGYLASQTSPKAWDTSEEKLFDLNKTLVTLSSSALVLSFSAIQIGKPSLNKCLIGGTWLLFLFVIVLGSVLIYIKFIRSLSVEIININMNLKKYKGKKKYNGLPEKLLLSKEHGFVYQTQSSMFVLSILQLVFFIFAFLFLILTAFLAI